MLNRASFSKTVLHELIVQVQWNQGLLRGASVSPVSDLNLLRRLEYAVKVPFSLILERVTFSSLSITKNCLVYLDGLLFLPSGPGNEQLRSLGEDPGLLGMTIGSVFQVAPLQSLVLKNGSWLPLALGKSFLKQAIM